MSAKKNTSCIVLRSKGEVNSPGIPQNHAHPRRTPKDNRVPSRKGETRRIHRNKAAPPLRSQTLHIPALQRRRTHPERGSGTPGRIHEGDPRNTLGRRRQRQRPPNNPTESPRNHNKRDLTYNTRSRARNTPQQKATKSNQIKGTTPQRPTSTNLQPAINPFIREERKI